MDVSSSRGLTAGKESYGLTCENSQGLWYHICKHIKVSQGSHAVMVRRRDRSVNAQGEHGLPDQEAEEVLCGARNMEAQ